MRKYCPNCNHFRDLISGSREHPPKGALRVEQLEDEKGNPKYGCYCPDAWVDPTPIKVTDMQLLRAVRCGSFMEREQ